VFLVPTLSAPVNIMKKSESAGIPKEFIDKTKRLKDVHIEGLLKAKEAGVKIAMGTDAGTPFNIHGENAKELGYMVENGFSESEAIQCSTSKAAELLGMQDKIGSISPGMLADLLIVFGNPLDDITILSDHNKIVAVYKGGEKVVN